MATMATRPSRATSVGNPAVKPSTERPTIWLAPSCTPARSSTSASGTPSHTALPTRSPPTSFDTHDSVTTSSTTSMAASSSKLSSKGSSTRPEMARRHESTGTRSEEHTSELQSLMRISYAVLCLKNKNNTNQHLSQTETSYK